MSTKKITLSELKKHKKADDCWLAIEGKVYNVTNFIDEHPGGRKILLDNAGTDATSEFQDINHSQAAKNMLREYYVGDFVTDAQQQQQPAPDNNNANANANASVNDNNNKDKNKEEQSELSKQRKKIPLPPGYSALHWTQLTNQMPAPKVEKFTMDDVKQHNKMDDAWIVLRGRVYDVTSYLKFHPGGVDELMRGVGRDATPLFDEVHGWVNFEFLLQKCCKGVIVSK